MSLLRTDVWKILWGTKMALWHCCKKNLLYLECKESLLYDSGWLCVCVCVCVWEMRCVCERERERMRTKWCVEWPNCFIFIYCWFYLESLVCFLTSCSSAEINIYFWALRMVLSISVKWAEVLNVHMWIPFKPACTSVLWDILGQGLSPDPVLFFL